MREVRITEVFESQPEAVFKLVFGTPLALEFQASQGNKDVNITEWAPGEDGRLTRVIKYVVPMNVPIPAAIRKVIGMVDTHAVVTEWATQKDGPSYEVTSKCELTGPPMVGNTKVVPNFSIVPEGTGSKLDLVIQFEFNVWGLASIVESTMESGVRKGFTEYLVLAKKHEAEAKAGGGAAVPAKEAEPTEK
eukprot:TRINITY_DN7131_c0_g1_i1.p2 TRINITY_DN7131_c0_g1~~TRINITY_DN7131_c0_g1_i1.p2  ORF type:complete len:191 (+),score=41.37 TRINITY_DN7131_c0_g1_i1:59-631(+)